MKANTIKALAVCAAIALCGCGTSGQAESNTTQAPQAQAAMQFPTEVAGPTIAPQATAEHTPLAGDHKTSAEQNASSKETEMEAISTPVATKTPDTSATPGGKSAEQTKTVTPPTAISDLPQATAEPSPTPPPAAPTPTEVPAPHVATAEHDLAMAQEAFKLQNQIRIQNGLAELAWDENIYQDAGMRCVDITQDFSHNASFVEGSVFGIITAENIAKGQTSAQQVINEWYASAGHQANMLMPNATSGAVACYKSGGNTYWVALFWYGY